MENSIGKFDRKNVVYKGIVIIDVITKRDDTAYVKMSKGLSGTAMGIGYKELVDFLLKYPPTQAFTIGGIEEGRYFNPKILIAVTDTAITAPKANFRDQYAKPSEKSEDGAKQKPTAAQLEDALALVKQAGMEVTNGNPSDVPAAAKARNEERERKIEENRKKAEAKAAARAKAKAEAAKA